MAGEVSRKTIAEKIVEIEKTAAESGI